MSINRLNTRVATVARHIFTDRWWEYEEGEHVSFIGPTGSGKTTLGYQLLRKTATVDLPAIVLVMKPRDVTVSKFSKAAKYRIVHTWPPMPSVWQPGKKAGYVLWPKHSFDEDHDDEIHERIFRTAIRDSYRQGKRIIFGDETYSLTRELKLEKSLIRIWSKGRSMGCGLWAATQKPTHVPLWMYSQPEHLFLAHDPDERAQKRFSEIGGVNPDIVKNIVKILPRYHWLYIRRKDRTMCVIDP